jgi:hypothetical protein
MINIRPRHVVTAASIAALAGCLVASAANAEVVVRGIEGKPLDEIRPAPTFFKPDLAVVTAQPSPSEVNPSFLGPVLLMKQAQVDLEKGTAKLPLRKGRLRSGETVWFVITDTTDENLANLHGLVYSPKLAYGQTGRAAREATIAADGSFVFETGKVDFSPEHKVVPGAAPNFFPPKAFQPGSVGDADYSPLVHIKNAAKDVIFNAPMLAFNDLPPRRNGDIGSHARLYLQQADPLSVNGSKRSPRRHSRGRDLRSGPEGRSFCSGRCLSG